MDNVKEYSPNATAYAVRCEAHTLRNWRTQGHLAGLSERKGKGHLFTVADVARIAIAAFIARAGASLRTAFEIVDERGALIDTIVAHERDAPGSIGNRFLTFVIEPDMSFPASITGAPVADIQFLAEPTAALQMNVSKLIRSVLERLKAYDESEWADEPVA